MTQGLYAAAVPAASLLLVGSDVLALFSFNAGNRVQEPLTRRQMLQGGAMIAAFQASVAGAFLLVVGPLIVLLYGDKFAGAVPFAWALIPAQAINGFGKVVEGHLRGRGIVHVGIWARMASASLIIAMVMLTFDRWGVMSIPLSATLGNSLVATVLAWYAIADNGSQSAAQPPLQSGEAQL